MPLLYEDVRGFVEAGLSSRGYGYDDGPKMPVFNPGIPTDVVLQKASPGSLVFLNLGDGPGLSVDGTFDRPLLRVRSISDQRDFNGGEQLALDIDGVLLAVGGNASINDKLVLYFGRAGGRPAPLMFDKSERYHFTCTYNTETPL